MKTKDKFKLYVLERLDIDGYQLIDYEWLDEQEKKKLIKSEMKRAKKLV